MHLKCPQFLDKWYTNKNLHLVSGFWTEAKASVKGLMWLGIYLAHYLILLVFYFSKNNFFVVVNPHLRIFCLLTFRESGGSERERER